ncbi:hypothetical protein F5878DRAFT_608075 [Lentinula raphanica]|uniref:DUF952 domain-containing protein n=1 Tax=Lentinula raphanica TaxID=153919 RepID=A0AA38UKV1_9AGAR|nr:hypothetical protein EV360DRAFT_43280 [Lentinula raphanica]KAJ3842267.1 hypothetical protein F5878DRAFT_608075 [Lentinula raphanica]
MSGTELKPNFIYKLVPSSESAISISEELPIRLPVSSIDQQSGFIHLSTSVQLLNTLKRFFAQDSSVFILRLPFDRLEEEKLIRWEDPKAEVCGPRGGEGMFPHLYNDLKLGKEEVDLVQVLTPVEGSWHKAIENAKEDGWLVY